MNQSQKTPLIIGISVVVVLLFIVFGFSILWGLRSGGFGMMGPGMMGDYGTMFLIPLLFILFLGLIVWAVFAALPKTGVSNTADYKTDTPLDILKRRYAQGEIDKEEYETKKKDLA